MGALFYFIITFILLQEIGFIDLFSNLKTFTGPNSAQLPFLYVITQTFETVNVDLEFLYLWLQKEEQKYWDGHQKHCFVILDCVYYLSTNKIQFPPPKSIHSGGLISEGAYNSRDLYISNLMSLYLVAPKTGRAYNRDFKRIYKKYIKKNI